MRKKILLLKYFIFFSLIFFLIFNWSKISWIFNYKGVFSYFSNRILLQKKYEASQKIKENKKEEFEFTEKENSIEIPSIQVFAPLFTGTEEKEEELLKTLDKGPVMLINKALPGQFGPTIILGHSAMREWPKSNPTWVFTYLKDIKEGDEIILNFEHKRYKYKVEKTYILKSGEDFPTVESENVLFLVTCWPPGRLLFKQKLVVEAKLKNRF